MNPVTTGFMNGFDGEDSGHEFCGGLGHGLFIEAGRPQDERGHECGSDRQYNE